MDMRFGTWNFRSLYSLDSLERASRQLVKFRLLIHRYSGSTGGQITHLPVEKELLITSAFTYIKSSEVKRLEFVSDRIILKG
jgi:hypothetical protein